MHRLVSVVGIADHAFGVEAVHHVEVVALPSAAVVEFEGAEQGQGGRQQPYPASVQGQQAA
jgi:hypothetical protein